MRRPEHRCPRQHKSYQALAQCLWPRALWIEGEGPHASVTWCGGLTVVLAGTPYEAWRWLAGGQYCGSRCQSVHALLRLSLPRDKRVAA